MKPYGVKVIQCPDIADIQAMGAKSSTGRIKRGRGYCRTKNKRRTRLFWKKAARRAAKEECNYKED